MLNIGIFGLFGLFGLFALLEYVSEDTKLPEMDLAVHGFGYLQENYGKTHFGFSEIPPEVPIDCDSFLMYLRLYFRF